ncbi:MAG: DMT family transporter [Chloroflexi bacterium]|nr:DMT family transporter [Chloroflexota bacterium]
MRQRWLADGALLLAAMVWGSTFVVQRLVGQDQGSVFWFNAARFALGAGLLSVGIGFRFPAERAFWRWAGLAGTLLFLGSALQQAGLRYTTAGNAGFLTSLYLPLVPLLLALFWRERPSGLTLAGVGLAVMGAYLLSLNGPYQARRGDLLVVLSAFFWSWHVILLSKRAAAFPTLAFAAAQFWTNALWQAGLGLVFEPWSVMRSSVFWVAVLYAAVFSVGLGFTLQVWGQQRTPATDAALILSLEAAFAALFGAWFLHERLSPGQTLGAGLIFAGVVLAQLRGPTKG